MKERHSKVLIIGAGPIGMITALELARYGVPSIIFDDDTQCADGSRAIAMHSSILEIFERNGCLAPMLEKAVVWNIRRTYHGDRELFTQQMPAPQPGMLPTFINLQQSYTEEFLYQRILQDPLIQLCWNHEVAGLDQDEQSVRLTIQTPEGKITASGTYVAACDGARSPTRKMLGLPFPGHSHPDSFLIVDIKADLPFERQPRFFFNHPTNPDSTILIHPQPDGVWRIDWQIGAEVDIELEKTPDRIDSRVRSLIGDVAYQIVWLSDYRFHQRILEDFQKGRVFFAGDSAHLVAPFGARGMNSGVLDAENLAWKLALVINGTAGEDLLSSYQAERWPAQMENQRVTDRTMRFMVPPNRWHHFRRKLVFSLCTWLPQARKWVDSGKMAVPYTYRDSPLNLADGLKFGPSLGAKAPDPLCPESGQGGIGSIRLRHSLGNNFCGLLFSNDLETLTSLQDQFQEMARKLPLDLIAIVPKHAHLQPRELPPYGTIFEDSGEFAEEFSARHGCFYLLRPDRHIASRINALTPNSVKALTQRLIRQFSLIQ